MIDVVIYSYYSLIINMLGYYLPNKLIPSDKLPFLKKCAFQTTLMKITNNSS